MLIEENNAGKHKINNSGGIGWAIKKNIIVK
jgi:hypothetical protein